VNEIPGDVQGLLRGGSSTVGAWTLAQICKHMADTIDASMDGFDLRRHRLKRWFFAKPLLAYTYRRGIPPGYTIDPNLSPPGNAELTPSFAELERAIRRYLDHQGRLHPHPLFGRLSRKGWDRLHCFHCAHHLRYAVPGGGAVDKPAAT